MNFKNKPLSTYLILSACFFLFFNSCIKENPIPAYVSLSPFTLTTKLGEGSAAQKITDAWVYVDSQSVGVYELPVTFPVLDLGNRSIQIAAGIRNNGIKSNPIIYPMTAFVRTNINLKAGDTTRMSLKTNYLDGLKFWSVEDFEGANHTLKINREIGGTPPSVNIIQNDFEGKCAEITLTKTSPLMEKAISTKAQLPSTATSTFIELHYKTQNLLEVGIWGTTSGNAVGQTTVKVVLKPNNEWNKVYLNLTQEAKDMKMTDYQVYVRSLLPDTLQQATILLDNIKLIQK